MKFTTKLNFLLILFVLVIATACGSSDDAADSSGSDDVAEVEDAPEEAAPVGDAAAGETVYGSLCVACHGVGAIGVDGLGKSFVESEFIGATSDEDLLEFVKVGRSVTDPDNTTGVDMPPKGGNPALSDEDIVNVIAYIRSLRGE